MLFGDIKDFKQLLEWLEKNLHWPTDKVEKFEDMTFEYDPKELGIKAEHTPHVREIHQLRPFDYEQAWGIFFINFEDKRIPIGVLKRILGGLTMKRRQSVGQKAWNKKDLLFISQYGRSGERELSFLYFTEEDVRRDKTKIVLKELGWDQQDTKRKLEYVEKTLREKLTWPNSEDRAEWHKQWPSMFTSTYGGVIKTSKDLTGCLAELATSIRVSVRELLEYEGLEYEGEEGPLTKIYQSFKDVLFHHLEEDDFADMYAQTICYELLAARIQRSSGALVADDAALIAPLTQPFLKDLMETFLAVGGRRSQIDFNELGVDEVVEMLKNTDMGEVLRDFGNKNPQEDPILYFYEYFLRDYDSIRRASRGVYYTPLSVVRFIVRSVDEVLIKEFGLQDGLADTITWGEMVKKYPKMTLPEHAREDMHFVQILDPATGTGTFLVEVIGVIEERLKNKWRKEGQQDNRVKELWSAYVSEHLLPRLHGFEVMMAPYAIAHIQIALKLHETGYVPLKESPRVRVYLTNSLEKAIGYGKQQEMSFITGFSGTRGQGG